MKGSSSIKRELLASLLAREGIQLSQGIIPKRKTSGTAPLSFAQRRVWFLNQLSPDNPFYNCSGAVRLRGNLDVEAFESAINEIVRRHEVLRTRFEVDAGEPAQVIDAWEPRRLELVDLRNLIREEREEEAQRIMSEEATAAFDLSRGPLLRVKVLKLGNEEHLALFTMHHIVSDGWSMGILFRELRTLYATYSVGEMSPLPELPIQYADFAAWQRGWLKGEALERQMEYWRTQLKDLPVLELPTDYARPAMQSFRGKRCPFTIDVDLSQRLQELSRAEGSTLFMTLLATFQALLGRYSGQQDVAVGTMIANRNRMETEGVIGFFVNQLVLRADLNEDQSFRELLRKVRRTTLESYSHQDLPFEMLVEELAPERSLDRSPLCQVVFALENASQRGVESQRLNIEESQGLSIEIVEIGRDSAKYDLTVVMAEAPGGLVGVWEYCQDLFEEETIRRMIGHFQTLLRSAVSEPESRLCELQLLTEAERKQILVEWNQTQRDYPRGRLLHELFEGQVERTPESVAVVYEDQELSYRELNRRANRLANYLISLGVGPEVVVGLCLERSVEMVVGLLGALKAGGAYLPLDPGHPLERLAYLLEDSQVSVLLSQAKIAEKLPVTTSHVICLDDEEMEGGRQNEENPHPRATVENLAYVIYTSGSTGQPKGVMVGHEGPCNMVRQQVPAFGVSRHDRVLQFAPLNFDASVSEIFMALSSGATLCLEDRERLRTTSELRETLRNKAINTVTLPPVALAMLDAEGLSEVGTIISAGEECSSKIAEQWAGGRRLFNAYGPTEGSVCTTLIELKAGGYNRPPIGRPIGNAQLYILDGRQDAAPVGVTGELYIGGMGLARGYLRQPEQTGEKFIPHPFSQDSGARLYRTGDLARYLPDGNVEFLGRADHQVKLRGYRIELGEIEAALCEHPDVKQSAVMLREDEPGQKRLVAYVVSNGWYDPPDGAYRLPNGLAIAQQNRNETEFLYQEIFVRQQYLRHGIGVKEDGCVFDVGANIGMFTAFIGEHYPGARVYAFEPIEETYQCLGQNAARYGERVKVFQQGLSDREAEARFTYYPRFSAMSRLKEYSNEAEDKELVRRYLKSEQQRGVAGSEELQAHADELLTWRFEEQVRVCRLRRLSDVMKEERVDRIDLLKIDVERAERDVLRGIDDADWEKIDQIVLEAHDEDTAGKPGRVRELVEALERHGYIVEVDEDEHLRGTGLYNLYARRVGLDSARSASPSISRREPVVAETRLTSEELREHLRRRIPEYMSPGAFVFLNELPLTPNGKVDRKNLPPAQDANREVEQEDVGERTPVEEILAGIFEEALGFDRVGIRDNFFEIGGHSLLATQVISRAKNAFGVNIAVSSIFEEPTIAGLGRKIEGMLRSGETAEAPPMIRVPRVGNLPLSFAQQRLWFIDQMEPGNVVYNIPGAVRLEGELDVKALESVINEIIRRHEALRTRIEVKNGHPTQVIDEWEPRRLEQLDLTSLPSEEREAAASRIVRKEAETGFDLSRGPLLRVKVLKLGDEDHLALYTMHHIVSDGWSMGILIREVKTLYRAYSMGRAGNAGNESPLPELEIQYADYAVWQRAYLTGGVLEKEVEYWRGRLKNAAVLELPTDRSRPPEHSYRGGSKAMWLDQQLSQGLRKLSRREGATLFMTLMAALKVVLMRYSGQEDISVGTVIANRTRKEVEGLIGFFVNTLVMRTGLSGNPSFRELIRREREVALGAYEHQELPFEKLVEELNPERDPGRNPLFQVVMALHNAERETLELPGVELSGVGGEVETRGGTRNAKFDLTWSIADLGRELAGVVTYSRDLFEAETIERLIDHYKNVLEGVAHDSERPIWSLDLLSERERKHIVEEWNATDADYPAEKLIHELFEEQAEKSPHAVALVYKEQSLTYSELNVRSNRLARRLRALGVGTETRVGICMERGLEMVVGMLAILKAGGAYVPLDTAYPAERLRHMVEDSRPVAVLTQGSVEGWMEGVTQVAVAGVRDEMSVEESGRNNLEAGEVGVRSEDVAYVIYTSGSVGTPKGVAVTHRGVNNLLHWMKGEFELDGSDVVLQQAPFSFDASVREIFWPLVSGARLVMPAAGRYVDPGELIGMIRRLGITTVKFVPTLLHAFLEQREVGESGSLRRVICGGETLSPVVARRFREQLPEVTFQHQYGPTETTVNATAWNMVSEIGGNHVPIGGPIANTRIYILDGVGAAAPVGAPGELYIGGAGVARGYQGRPELTGERFVPDAFAPEAGARMYRTGDLGRWRADGTIEFLGRNDYQVKVRGFRIELGEIEARLGSHPGVREAVVIAREDEAGEKRLVAYVVNEGEREPSAGELRSYLKERLPEYMTPSWFVPLRELPLTPNGKVNRRALPAPDVMRVEEDEGYQSPRTPVEEIVVGIFEEVLKLDRVGVEDNFFEIGGHSLLATQVISRVRNAFGVEIGLRSIFEEGTAQGLAGRIEKEMSAGENAPAPPLVRVDRGGEKGRRFPLSFAQQRLWFIDQLEPANAAYNIPSAVRLEGGLNLDALERGVNEIVRRHEVLRTRFEMEAGEPAQVIDEWKPRRLEVEDLTSLPPEEREEKVRGRMMEEAQTGFDLSAGQLLRVKVLKLGEAEHVVLYTMHHIVGDGWSMMVMIREVSALYDAISAGRVSPLPELKIQYADYAYWQRSYLRGEVLEEHLQYWKNRLDGKLSVIKLPADRPRPPVPSYRGAAKSIPLPAELCQSIRALGRREGVTLFMLLLAAFKALLYRYTAQKDVIVGAPLLNRDRVELEPLIGFFINLLPLRTDVSGNPRFRELLMRVKDAALGAYAHQEAPLEKVVEEMRPERKVGQLPLYNVVFGIHNRRKEEDVNLNGLKISRVGLGQQVSKYDLMLSINNEEQEVMVAGWVYSADLFEEETIIRMHRHFETLLFSIVARPDAPLDELETFSEAEKTQLADSRAARKELNYSRFKSVKPRSIPLSED